MQNEKNEGADHTGKEFLLKNDKKHLALLAKLNEKIKLFDDNIDVYRKKDLIKFINDHYKTFIARLQAGLPFRMLRGLLMEWGSYSSSYIPCYVLHDPLKFIDEAKNRGLIFAICYNKEGTEMMYIIDPKKEFDQKKCKSTIERIKRYNDVKKIKVIAPGKNMVEDALEKMLMGGNSENDLTLLPINEVCFSCISSRQTKAVENCCKVINSFTEEKTNKKMDVTLEGESQGVDFITKMVGSTHGKTNRIKNANIELNIKAPHRWQDEKKIVKRLRNGVENKNNTITKICINKAMGEWLHPICKADNLSKCLKYHQKELNNATIEVSQPLGSGQQNAFY